MDKNKLVIINAFPKDSKKIKMLEDQVSYLKQLNIPILVVSGCTIPKHISDQIDYSIINTENDILDKDWTRKIVDSGNGTYVCDVLKEDNFHAYFYWPNVNQTITKNIKLAFNMAKFLGYKNVFYTEDDNIWKEGSFNYINDNLEVLVNNQYKLAGVIGDQNNRYPIFFTTFFFANVDFLVDNFILPHTREEWYDIDIINKFKLNMTYEGCWYDLFSDRLDLIYNSHDAFVSIANKEMDWGIYDRRHSEQNLLKTFFTVMPSNQNTKVLVLNNSSYHLKEGGKSYHIDIYFDDTFGNQVHLVPYGWYYSHISNEIKEIKLTFDDGNVKIDHYINCDWESIKNNGEMIFVA